TLFRTRVRSGFMLGTIRTLWVAPRFGTRIAELMEMPIMLIVTIVAARWITASRCAVRAVGPPRNGCHRARSPAGRGIRPRALASRPVDQGVSCKPRPFETVYYLMLGMFAIMPFLIARR